MSHSNLTKYCACHAKWLARLILTTYGTSFTMRGATSVTFQPHQILRLPRKMITQNLTEICWKQVKRHLNGRSEHDPSMIRAWTRRPATRRATEVTFRARHKHFVLKHATFRAPASFPNFARCCTCHEKWHLNFTKYCACHQKWLLSFTKYCACHEKSRLNLTKYCACHEKFLLLCLYYYLTIPIPIAWLYYSLQVPTTWALLLLDDSYYLTLLLRDDSYDLTLLLHDSDSYYLTLLLLADSYNLTLLVLDSYYSTLLLLDDFYYLTLLLRDDSFYLTLLLDSAMSFVYRKFLNLNFLWWYTLGPMQAALCRYMIHAFCESSF